MHDRVSRASSDHPTNQCVSFSRDAKAGIETHIKTTLETYAGPQPGAIPTRQLDDMQGQLDKFTKTYADRT